MMMPWKKTRLLSVSDPGKRNRVQELLAQNQIPFEIKVKELHRINPADSARIGCAGVTDRERKRSYIFYVEKSQAKRALEITGRA